jgi:hypothetical protein
VLHSKASASERAPEAERARIYERNLASGPPSGPPLDEDPTAFISDEDYDYGLLMRGIITDSERRNVMLGD